jgi:hypothetical protein
MFRELAQIVLAIQLSATGPLSASRVNSWAHVIQQQAVKVDVDPVEIVAIIAHESQFHERAISYDHEDYGLMQVRARYYGPNHNALLYGEHNIRVGSYIIGLSKDICRKRLGREPTTQEWLSPYQGSIPSCKPTKLTKLVNDFAQCLSYRVDFKDIFVADCRKIYWPYIAPLDNSLATR